MHCEYLHVGFCVLKAQLRLGPSRASAGHEVLKLSWNWLLFILFYAYLYHFPPLIGIAIRHFRKIWRRYWMILIWLLILSCQGDVSPIKCKARRFQKCSQIHKCLQIQRQRHVTHWAKILTDCHILGLSWDHLSVFILTLGMQSHLVWCKVSS